MGTLSFSLHLVGLWLFKDGKYFLLDIAKNVKIHQLLSHSKIKNIKEFGTKLARFKLQEVHFGSVILFVQLQHLIHMSQYMVMEILSTRVENILLMVLSITRQES